MINWTKIIGKTIESVDEEFGSNVVVLNFTDKTSVVIDTETIHCGLHCPVLYTKESYGEQKE